MRFVREIPIEKAKQAEIEQLHQFGFTLVYTSHSIEVWASVTEMAA